MDLSVITATCQRPTQLAAVFALIPCLVQFIRGVTARDSQRAAAYDLLEKDFRSLRRHRKSGGEAQLFEDSRFDV